MKQHKKPILSCLIFLLLVSGMTCFCLAAETAFVSVPAEIRPGKSERIVFTAAEAGTADLILTDGGGEWTVQKNIPVSAGQNNIVWNGFVAGQQPEKGDYLLRLTMNGRSADIPVKLGSEAPQIIDLTADERVTIGKTWTLKVETNTAGTLTVTLRQPDGGSYVCLREPVVTGENRLVWDTASSGLEAGDYTLLLSLTDESGFAGTSKRVSMTLDAPRVVIPSAVRTQADENSYWTYPVGDLDEAAIWEIMMQPITVLGEEKKQKDVYQLRATPDASSKSSNIVGEITYASQGVHVLETLDNGWTLVEAYNSSYGPNCASRRGYGVTDDLIRGYVKTSLLRQITPRTDYALLIDKLNQTMYIFSDGKCIGTLLVSTGLNNDKQSWNETPSGEFVMISKMGGFYAGNLYCDYGMRVNGGCAIHEVPYIGTADTPAANRDYSSTVPQLGKKASHGCIRVQKAPNENGQNIKWLWNNIKTGTKVLIWDDTGRWVDYPDDDTPIYYNPAGGTKFHENQYCPSVKDRYLPLTAITYGELNTTFQNLKPCSTCVQIMTKKEIDKMNRDNGFEVN